MFYSLEATRAAIVKLALVRMRLGVCLYKHLRNLAVWFWRPLSCWQLVFYENWVYSRHGAKPIKPTSIRVSRLPFCGIRGGL